MRYIAKNGKCVKLNNIIKKKIFVVAMIFFVATIFFYSEGKTRDVIKHKDVISFAGDIFPRYATNVKAYKQENGIHNLIDYCFKNIIDNSDYFVGNLECCISDEDTPADKEYTLKLSPEYVDIIKESNFDLMTLANNHILDYGKQALQDTIKNLEKIGVAYVGAGDNYFVASKPYETIINNRKYVFYSASAVSPSGEWFATENDAGINDGYHPSILANDIKIKKEEDPDCVIIMYMHWGKEKDEMPTLFQKQCAKILIDAGCDLVVGSHPHVVQNIEYYKGVPIIYSLGNFIFGGTMTDTILLEVIFDYENGDKNIYLNLHPGISGYEKVYPLYKKVERDKKIKDILLKSPTCMIDKKGYIVEKK